jgi:hypothetical protein
MNPFLGVDGNIMMSTGDLLIFLLGNVEPQRSVAHAFDGQNAFVGQDS